jgi:hypothetical protein
MLLSWQMMDYIEESKLRNSSALERAGMPKWIKHLELAARSHYLKDLVEKQYRSQESQNGITHPGNVDSKPN